MDHIIHKNVENEKFLFTSESVGEGHPGKFTKLITIDIILNLILFFFISRQNVRSN